MWLMTPPKAHIQPYTGCIRALDPSDHHNPNPCALSTKALSSRNVSNRLKGQNLVLNAVLAYSINFVSSFL